MEQLNPEESSTKEESVQEFSVRIPKDKQKKHNVMRFNNPLNTDIKNWKQVKMQREDNFKEFKQAEGDPKFGAGSTFGKEQREEVRLKKYGIVVESYDHEKQPWMLQLGGKGGKRYKGVREGGVNENSSYYVLKQAPDGSFEAYLVEEWYNFTPDQCFKLLSAEEAEVEYARHEKRLDHCSIMMRKRLQNVAADGDAGEEEKSTKRKKGQSDFQMDDWKSFAGAGDSESDEEAKGTSHQSAKRNAKKEKKSNKSDDEGREESDEGDKEVDYITSGSSDEEQNEVEKKANLDYLKGVEDEKAISNLISDEDEEEEEEEEEDQNMETEEKATEPKLNQKQNESVSSEESSSDSDSDFDDSEYNSAIFVSNLQKSQTGKKVKDGSPGNSAGSTLRGQEAQYAGASSSSLKDPELQNQAVCSSSMPCTSSDSYEQRIRSHLQLKRVITVKEMVRLFKKTNPKISNNEISKKVFNVVKKMGLQKIQDQKDGIKYFSLKTK